MERDGGIDRGDGRVGERERKKRAVMLASAVLVRMFPPLPPQPSMHSSFRSRR